MLLGLMGSGVFSASARAASGVVLVVVAATSLGAGVISRCARLRSARGRRLALAGGERRMSGARARSSLPPP